MDSVNKLFYVICGFLLSQAPIYAGSTDKPLTKQHERAIQDLQQSNLILKN
jgi:hypothetical protein